MWVSARVLHVFEGSVRRKTDTEPWGQAQARHLPSVGIPDRSRVQLRTLEVSGHLPQKRKRGQGRLSTVRRTRVLGREPGCLPLPELYHRGNGPVTVPKSLSATLP